MSSLTQPQLQSFPSLPPQRCKNLYVVGTLIQGPEHAQEKVVPTGARVANETNRNLAGISPNDDLNQSASTEFEFKPPTQATDQND